MATMDYWASAPMPREQMTLFAPTLDAMIGEDDSVRLFDEVLSGIDWTQWEAEYDGGCRGQPPIHPRHPAACLLYGMCRGIRSSRKLEEACVYRLDFVWLLEGRQIDHSTLAKFRTRFAKPLKDLFRQVCRVAMSIGLIRLGEVAFDGTRVRANNSRYRTRTAKVLEEKLKTLDALFEQMLAEAKAADQKEAEGADASPTRLPKDLADLEQRRQRVQEALQKAKAGDEARKQNGIDPQKNPVQIPTTDPDSRVMPNKEGGYAPNYTPTAITDGECGFILDADVLAEVNESSALLPGLQRVEEMCGQRPEKLLTDAGNNSGQILEPLEEQGIEVYVPVEANQPLPGNPAFRDDPTQPVPEEEWPKLPRNGRSQLAKSCFVYNEEQDEYRCPQGHAMRCSKSKSDVRSGERVPLRVYRCSQCAGCPLAAACLGKTAQRGRTVTRDGYEGVRERTAARMASEAGKKVYNERPRIAEQPFGLLKRVMGLRQFLLRGLEKVKTEWSWAVTAFNVGKLVRELGRLRAEVAKLASETTN
jgi:transposase